MSAPSRGELDARFEELLAQARAAGEYAALAPAWRARLEPEAAPDASDGAKPFGRFGMIGASAKMRAVYDLLARICKSDVSVLVRGETGTGKELVARALHEHGPRAKKPFMAENCAAVPAQLLESELFGHKRGSFTGAIADRPGHFVAANGGTVFLDEIGDMPLPMQAKLLRVLQDGEVRAVGANNSVKVDVRIVAATNKDLRAMCVAKTFREDLYFRLSVVTITLPPLREREGDVRLLARAFAARVSAEMKREPVELSEAALAVLEASRWQGNVRELDNEIRRAIALLPAGRRVIDPSDLTPR
ncbi:MAG: sigma-54-dependent Fis family transcriptional regulator [Planctomycetota bacterium]|nr:MAG: sigma-54-dependent Fis family transcriptional regulator [Planctomycetota bacterium]